MERGEQAAGYALTMVGKPYRYGGSSPSGFDCSGLVAYSYKNAGVALPRSTDKQRSASRSIKVAELRRGDLLFFNQEGKKYGHVAIYVGGGKFVHAPSSGKSVRSDRLDSPVLEEAPLRSAADLNSGSGPQFGFCVRGNELRP